MRYDIIWEDYPDHFTQLYYLTSTEIINLVIPPLFQVNMRGSVEELAEQLRSMNIADHIISHNNIIIRRD